MTISTGEPLTAGTRTPLSRRLVPRVTARSTVMGTPRRPLRTPATIRPVLRSSPRRYQPPAPAMTAPSSAATATICTIRRARDFMGSQYQTVPRNQDSRSGWAPRIAIMGPTATIYMGSRDNDSLSGRRERRRGERLITLGQAEHVLREVVQHHLLGHRCDLVEPHLAEQSLDVKLLRVPVAAVRLHGHVAGLEARVGGQQLGRVRLGPAGTTVVEEPGRLHRDELGRLQLGPRVGERMSDRLVLADRSADDHAPITWTLGTRLDARGVGARVGLGDAERHHTVAAGDRRQVALLERRAAVLDDRHRRKDVEVDRRGAGGSRAGRADLVEENGRLGDAEPGAAVLFGDHDAQPATGAERLHELPRIVAALVLLEPVVGGKRAGERRDFLADELLLLGERKVHDLSSPAPGSGGILLHGDSPRRSRARRAARRRLWRWRCTSRWRARVPPLAHARPGRSSAPAASRIRA